MYITNLLCSCLIKDKDEIIQKGYAMTENSNTPNTENQEQVAQVVESQDSISSTSLLSETYTSHNMKTLEVKVMFDELAINAANTTLTLINRKLRYTTTPYVLDKDVDLPSLEGYYKRLILARLNGLWKAHAGSKEYGYSALPAKFGPKFAFMLDVFQVTLGHITFTKLDTPKSIIKPYVSFDLEEAKTLCDDDKFKLISDILRDLRTEFNLPFNRGIPSDESGTDEFMKFAVINDIVKSIEKDWNPLVLSYAAFSGHQMTDQNLVNFYGYDISSKDEIYEDVFNNILNRK